MLEKVEEVEKVDKRVVSVMSKHDVRPEGAIPLNASIRRSRGDTGIGGTSCSGIFNKKSTEQDFSYPRNDKNHALRTPHKKSMRLDLFISERYGYSRNKAKSFIEKGLVSIDARVCKKPSEEVSEGDNISIVQAPELEWVSRSAGKLEGFFQELGVGLLTGKTALDIGSSTGGFTQILLAHDIAHVDAVDVGTLQLHESIRGDARVASYENTDIRDFSPGERYDIITIDVSFISLREIFPILERLARQDTDIYALYKPQFEVGKENLRKTGVPKDVKIIEKNLREFQYFLDDAGFSLKKSSKASVVGEAGNQEYMMWIQAHSV